MKIRRFFAPDIRQAMRMVREAQGPDAVILSNRRVEGGVEIVAAIDYDERALSPGRAGAVPRPEPMAASRPEPSSVAAALSREPEPSAGPSRQTEPGLQAMRDELNTLRRMLEGKLSSLAWNTFTQGEPRRVELIERLLRFGLSAAQSRVLVDAAMGDGVDVESAWQRALEQIRAGVPVWPRRLLDEGGTVALVGPSGAGKTTTAAKLAAQFALRHGATEVAMVSTDSARIGGWEQLRAFGRLLDVSVRTADSDEALGAVLDELADRRLILIDTGGPARGGDDSLSRDNFLDRWALDLSVMLVLPATCRQSGLHQVIDAFSALSPDAAIITRVDETTCLGSVLGVATASQLPLAWIADGQRVPDDLHPAEAGDLVARATHIMNRTGPRIDEDLVTLKFGREIANANH